MLLLEAKLSDIIVEPNPSIKLTKEADEQIRRDSLLFEEVSQGLVKLDTVGPKVENKREFYRSNILH